MAVQDVLAALVYTLSHDGINNYIPAQNSST